MKDQTPEYVFLPKKTFTLKFCFGRAAGRYVPCLALKYISIILIKIL